MPLWIPITNYNGVEEYEVPRKRKKKGLLRKAIEMPFKVVREVAKPVVKNLPKGVRNSLPVIGAIGGSLLGGPLGGVLGGSLGGAARGGRHPMDHALGGAAMGGLSSLMMSGLGSGAAGLAPSAGAMVPGGAAAGAVGAGTAGTGGLFGSSGILSSLIGGGGGMGTMLNAGLLATAIGGNLKAKKKKNPRENETLQEAMERTRGKNPSLSSADWNKPLNKRGPMQNHPKGYKGFGWNYFPTAEEQEEQLKRVSEELAQQELNQEEVPNYAHGGYVEDYYEGQDGGQSDRRLTKVRPKSYIVNSTTVSLAGDGNSNNGAKVIKDWAKSFQNGHFVNENPEKVISAYVSDGEVKIHPEELMAIGRGNIKNGVKTIKKMEKTLRKHKGVNKFLPPKSKSLDKYAGIKR